MVMGIPTVVVIKGGEAVERLSGGQKRPRIVKLIDTLT